MIAGRAIFPCEENDLQVKFFPRIFRKQPFEIPLGLQDVLSRAEAPALRAAMNVRIDGKCRLMKRMDQHDGSGFMTYARQFFQLLQCMRNASAMAIDQIPG